MSFTLRHGNLPLLVSIPHNGSHIPGDCQFAMTDQGLTSKDTDWFLGRLYDFPELEDASMLVANISRYVIDLNRPKDDTSLYPGQTTTGLVPETRFDGHAIYHSYPMEVDIQYRIKEYWEPYHAVIEKVMESNTEKYGFSVLIEAHSIASRVPRLFEGRLPDFNIGTNHQSSCDSGMEAAVVAAIKQNESYTWVANERFVGGYITREYGKPDQNWHSLQIELSQATYMDEESLEWHDAKAKDVQQVLRNIIVGIKSWVQEY